jgi:hypothetical protein
MRGASEQRVLMGMAVAGMLGVTGMQQWSIQTLNGTLREAVAALSAVQGTAAVAKTQDALPAALEAPPAGSKLASLEQAPEPPRAAAEAPAASQAPLAAPTPLAPVVAVEPDGPHMESFLAAYAYSEAVERKPASIVLASLDGIPEGTPAEEIMRASGAFDLDPSFMMAVAKVESDFNPRERTGKYVGLYQLSSYEFDKYGEGSITDARDNAIAAAYKFATHAALFEMDTHRKPTPSDLYLIHQQGWQGAAQHVAHPERIAWESMCATDEGRQKGEAWCKRAIWGNTLPSVKAVWKSVDKLTSGAFVSMWQDRVSYFLARFGGGATKVAARQPERKDKEASKREEHRHAARHYRHRHREAKA